MTNVNNEELETYRVIDYFDVWGNEEDGFEVNNLAHVTDIEIKDYTDYNEMFQALIDVGFLTDEYELDELISKFDIWNDYTFIEFHIKDNYKPCFRLELV